MQRQKLRFLMPLTLAYLGAHAILTYFRDARFLLEVVSVSTS